MNAEKFWTRVEKSDGCWLWIGRCLPSGYGRLRFDGSHDYAHRVAYKLAHGPIPPGLEIDHVREAGCTHKNCVRPSHLEAVTPRENTRRSDAPAGRNSRKTHCSRGHLLSGDNLYLNKAGNRVCRECVRMHGRVRDAKRRLLARAQVEMSA